MSCASAQPPELPASLRTLAIVSPKVELADVVVVPPPSDERTDSAPQIPLLEVRRRGLHDARWSQPLGSSAPDRTPGSSRNLNASSVLFTLFMSVDSSRQVQHNNVKMQRC